MLLISASKLLTKHLSLSLSINRKSLLTIKARGVIRGGSYKITVLLMCVLGPYQ